MTDTREWNERQRNWKKDIFWANANYYWSLFFTRNCMCLSVLWTSIQLFFPWHPLLDLRSDGFSHRIRKTISFDWSGFSCNRWGKCIQLWWNSWVSVLSVLSVLSIFFLLIEMEHIIYKFWPGIEPDYRFTWLKPKRVVKGNVRSFQSRRYR